MAAARMELIVPFLVGPRERIVAIATANGIDLAGAEIVEAANSEASASAAVKLVREGKAEALMKGSLHTDELMAAVVRRETGLRTARRVSHCFVMDVPGREEGLIITDAAVNIFPTLEEKADILQNAIDLAHALGIADVRVAVLSAMETINSKVPSTIEAAALCKMMDRHQVSGALIDGPLALDNAIDPEGGTHQEDRIAGGRPRQRAAGAGPRGRQHARQEPDLHGRRRCRRHRPRRAGTDHPHQPRRFAHRPGSPPAPSPCSSPRRGARRARPWGDRHGRRHPGPQRRLVEPQVQRLRARRRGS
jgi:hypothetical protein